jgi:hypothetical protein
LEFQQKLKLCRSWKEHKATVYQRGVLNFLQQQSPSVIACLSSPFWQLQTRVSLVLWAAIALTAIVCSSIPSVVRFPDIEQHH